MILKNRSQKPKSFPVRKGFENLKDHHWHSQVLAPNANFLIDQTTRIINVNITGAAMLGERHNDLPGYKFHDFLHEDSQDLFYSQQSELINTGSNQVCELRLVTKDDQILKVKLISTLASNNDKSTRMRLFVNDITNDNIPTVLKPNKPWEGVYPEFICRFIADGTITYVNHHLCELMDMQFQDLIGQKLFQYLDNKTVQEIKGNLNKINPDNPFTVNEQKFDMFKTGIRWYQWMNYGLFNENNCVIEYYSFGRDITKFKLPRQETKTQDFLNHQDSLSLLGRLSGDIAHEVKNILGGISLFTDILSDSQKENRTDEEKDILKEIKQCIYQGNAFVEHVSNFSKSTICSSQRTDIKKLVQRNWKLWQLISKKSNLILDAKIEANLPYINGDQSCLQQVLTSLITNTSLVIKKGAICILVSKESSSHDNQEMIFFKVMGNPRMPVEQLENIFNPDFRDVSNQGKISLYLSNQIIKKLGGRIYLENDKHSGSIFVVELPLLKEH